MTSIERVRALLKERKIPVSRLEKDLGFGNGYLSSLKQGVLPTQRLYAVADYLGVTPHYLLTGEEESAPARPVSDEELKFALFGGDGEITDEMYREVLAFASFVKKREAEKKE